MLIFKQLQVAVAHKLLKGQLQSFCFALPTLAVPRGLVMVKSWLCVLAHLILTIATLGNQEAKFRFQHTCFGCRLAPLSTLSGSKRVIISDISSFTDPRGEHFLLIWNPCWNPCCLIKIRFRKDFSEPRRLLQISTATVWILNTLVWILRAHILKLCSPGWDGLETDWWILQGGEPSEGARPLGLCPCHGTQSVPLLCFPVTMR